MLSEERQPAQEKKSESVEGIAPRVCPACGATARRAKAEFCATCGRSLSLDSYLPADALRASYHLQQQKFYLPPPAQASPARRRQADAASKSFMGNHNGAASLALAFVTFSLVPYLGILFCPGSFVMGGVGLFYARRAPHRGGQRASWFSIAMAFVVCAAQVFLWWILYKVPEWSQLPGRF